MHHDAQQSKATAQLSMTGTEVPRKSKGSAWQGRAMRRDATARHSWALICPAQKRKGITRRSKETAMN